MNKNKQIILIKQKIIYTSFSSFHAYVIERLRTKGTLQGYGEIFLDPDRSNSNIAAIFTNILAARKHECWGKRV